MILIIVKMLLVSSSNSGLFVLNDNGICISSLLCSDSFWINNGICTSPSVDYDFIWLDDGAHSLLKPNELNNW